LIRRGQSECELCVGGEQSGELVVWLVKFAWIRECVKARLPNHQDQQKASQTQRMGNYNSKLVCIECTSINVSLILLVLAVG